MDKRTPIDELRALLAGTLSSEEAERVRERCAADPELRALLDEIAEVEALTAPAAESPPPCRLTFDDVESALVPQRARRMVLQRPVRVAAAVLVLVAGVYALSLAITDREDGSGEQQAVVPAPESTSNRSTGGEAGRPLTLAEIPLRMTAAPETGPELPPALADFRPVKDGKIQWIDSFSDAKAMARACSRPVLLFLHIPSCGWCKKMRKEALVHPDVLARVDAFVPLHVNWLEAPPELHDLVETWENDWPWLGTLDADGNTILDFPGLQGAGDLSGHLGDAAKLAGPPVITWEKVNEATRLLLRAKQAEESGDYGPALGTYRGLLDDDDAGPLHAAARRGAERIAFASREQLLAARHLADEGADPDALLKALDTAIDHFRDTPYARDFEAVRNHVRKHHTFPRITDL